MIHEPEFRKVAQSTIGYCASHLHLQDLLAFVMSTVVDPFVFFERACFWAPAIFFTMRGIGHPFVIPSESCVCVMVVFFFCFFATFVVLVSCQRLPSSRLMIHEPDVRKYGEFTLHDFFVLGGHGARGAPSSEPGEKIGKSSQVKWLDLTWLDSKIRKSEPRVPKKQLKRHPKVD